MRHICIDIHRIQKEVQKKKEKTQYAILYIW